MKGDCAHFIWAKKYSMGQITQQKMSQVLLIGYSTQGKEHYHNSFVVIYCNIIVIQKWIFA